MKQLPATRIFLCMNSTVMRVSAETLIVQRNSFVVIGSVGW